MGIAIKKYIWILGLVLSVVLSFFLAKITSLFIQGTFFSQSFIPAASQGADGGVGEDSQKDTVDLNVILKRNFFDAKESMSTKTIATDTSTDTSTNKVVTKTDTETDTNTNVEAVLTSLDIKLWSTISVGDGKNPYSSCVVGSGKDIKTYTIKSKEGFSDTKIVRILPKRVEFLNKGKLEYVELEQFAKAKDMTKPPKAPKKIDKEESTDTATATSTEIQQEGDVIKVSRAVVDAALVDPTKLYTDIRAVPYVEDGKPMGFKLLSVKSGSLFQKLGVKRGDVLKTINGKVFDIQTGLQMMDMLKTESEFSIDLQRRGEDKTFKYQIQ